MNGLDFFLDFSGAGAFVVKMRAFLTVFILSIAWAGGASAQPIPPTCDPDIHDVHAARSWMGAKRDFESAQTLITVDMADSLLYMSCFEKHIAEFAETDMSLFSDGHLRIVSTGSPVGTLFRIPPLCFGPMCIPVPWLTGAFVPNPLNPLVIVPQMPIDLFQPLIIAEPGPNPPGPPFTNLQLDTSLINLVRTALRPYWRDNFLPTIPPIPLPAPPAVICGDMAEIWMEAKCENINKDYWLTLEQHICNDRRECEPGCRGKWVTAFEVSNPLPVRWPAVGPGVDESLLLYETVYHPPPCSAQTPLRTGVVILFDGAMRQDAVCAGINCWYDYNNATCNE